MARDKLDQHDFMDIMGNGNGVSYHGSVENGIIAEHRMKYHRNVKRMKKEHENDKWSYTTLAKRLHAEPIYATKYNHNLEGSIMNHYQVECKIQLS